MLSKIQSPKTKQDLIRSLQGASIRSVQVFEAGGLSDLPAKSDLIRQKVTVIVIKS